MFILLLRIFQDFLLLGERDWLTVSIVHLLVSLEVRAVEQHLLLVVQVVFEEAFLVHAVDALLVQARVVAHVLLLHIYWPLNL